MTDQEYKALMEKIEREFPIRLKMAEVLGRKINVKNYKELEEFDDTIPELFLQIWLEKREWIPWASALIEELPR